MFGSLILIAGHDSVAGKSTEDSENTCDVESVQWHEIANVNVIGSFTFCLYSFFLLKSSSIIPMNFHPTLPDILTITLSTYSQLANPILHIPHQWHHLSKVQAKLNPTMVLSSFSHVPCPTPTITITTTILLFSTPPPPVLSLPLSSTPPNTRDQKALARHPISPD